MFHSKNTGLIERKSDCSGPLIDRSGDDISLPKIHDTHLERHWPKYLAVVVAIGGGIHMASLLPEKYTIGRTLALMAIATVFFYFLFSGLKMGADAIHTARTVREKSPAFWVGMLLGLGYWVYSTFVSPTMVFDQELGMQTALYDGIQPEDWKPIAFMLVYALIYAMVGGYIVEFLKTRFFK